LLNKAFTQMDTVSERHSSDDDEWVFEEPQATGWYAIGADWAKEKDKTVIVVARVDEKPWRIVYLRAVNRKPYPEMAEMFNDALMKYQAVAAHDGTGIGNVINDYIDERAHKVLMVGRGRTELLVDYINAVEKGVYRLPANTPAFDARTRARQWMRCMRRGSGTAICQISWRRSRSCTTRQRSRPLRLLVRVCHGRRTSRDHIVISRMGRTSRWCP
jgi:phage FluMu gp28-like protein